MVVGGTSANAGHAQIPDVQNIMGGMESTAGVRLHNHRRKLRQRFDIIRKLGQGTYGKVQLGVNKETGQEVAIKTIKKAKIETEADLVRIRREIQIMSSVRHPNIIHIYEVFENREKMVLVMEYAAGGELYDYLSARKVLAEEEARRVFRQVASSVYYCHKHQICHRDLKLENILLDEKGNAKIADFGLSNVFDERRMLTTFCGSPLYASPEIVRGTPYIGPEVDCWSLGVLLYTLVYGAMPFDGSNFKRLVKQISQGDYYEPKKPSPASSLIRHMLTVDPKCRASAEDICTHWWVNEGYGESCLEIAEHLANQTPVRLDLLLSLIPPPPTPPSTATEPAAADETDSMNDYATAQSEPSKEEEEVGEGKSDSHEKKKKRKEKKEKDKDSKRKREEEKEEAPPPAPTPPPLTEAPPPNEPTPLSSSQVFLDAIGPEPDTLPLPVPNSPEMEVDEGVSTSSSWTMAQDTPIPQDPPTEPEIPAEIAEFLPAMTSATESSVSEPKFEEVDDLPPASPVEFEIANSESVAAVQVLPLTPWQTHAESFAEPSKDQSGLAESDSCVLRDSNTAKETNRTSIGSVFSDSSLRDLDKDSDKEMISPPSGRVSLRDRLETSGSTTPSTPSPTRLNDKRHSRVFRQAELFESQQQSQPASPPSRTMTLERPKKVTLYGLKVSDTRRMYEDKLANEKKPAVVVPSLKVSDAKRAFEISAATLKTRSASSSNNFSRSSTAFPRRTVILTPDSAPIQKPQPVTRPKSESSIKHSATSPLRVDSPPSAIESGIQPSKRKQDAASRKEEEEDREAVVVGGLGVRIGAVGKVTGIAMETKAVPSKPTTPTPVPVQVAAAPVPVPVSAPAGDVTQEKAARRAVKVSVKALELAPVVKRVASPEPAQHQVPVVVDTGVGPAHTVSMLVAGSTALNHTTSPPDTPRERFVASPPPDFPKRVASPPCKPPLSGRVTSPTRVMVVQSPPVERMTSPLPWTKAMPPAPARVKSPPPVPANTQSLTNLTDNKSQILYPIQVTASTTGKKERIIPIQVEGRNRTAQATLPTPPPPTQPAGPTPAPPTQQTAPTPPPAVVTPPAEVVTRRQESVLSEAESDSSRLSGWREPIRKSPREVIIPIAMEGGGFVTPKVQTPSANTAEIKKPLRFDRSKRFGSLLSEEDDFGSGALGLQRLSSFGKRHETPREDGWGRTSRRLERSDSVSSGDDDDDDTFQLLTAESLFSNLLSRVRHLTRRANRDEPILIRTRYTSPAPSNASEPRYSTTIHCTRESSDNGDGSRSTSRSENSRGRGDGGSEAGSANRWSRASPSSESGSSRTENMRRFPSRDESSSTWRRSSVPRETSLPPQESSSITDTSAAYTTSTLPRVRPASRVTLSVHVPAHPTSVSLVPAPSRITSSSALTLVQSPNPPSPWPLPQEREREAFNPGRHSWRSSVSFSVSSASSSPPSSIKSGDMDRYPLTAMLTRQALQSHLRQTGSDLIHPPQPNTREDSDNFSDASSSSSYRNNSLAWALARLNTVLKDTTAHREYTRTLSNRELGENGAPSTNNSHTQPKDGRRYQRYGRSATAGEWTDTNPSSKSDGSGLSDEETRLSYRTYTRTSSREYLSPDKDYGSLSNHSSRPTSPVSTNSLPRPVHHNPPPLQPVQEANEDSKAPTPQLERKCPPPAPVVIPVIPNALISPKPQPKGGSATKIPVKPAKAPEPVPEPVPVVVLRSTPHRGARPYTAFYVPEMTNATPGPQATPIPVDQTNNGGICNGNVRRLTDTDEERKSAGGKRVSRFLRPDFFDTPREESAYVKKAPPIDLDAAEKAKAKFLKSVEKRWEKYRWDDAKNPVTAAATVNPPTVATITVKPPTLVDSSTQTSNNVTSPSSSPPKPVISECVTHKSIMNQESHNCKESPPSQGQPVVSVKAKEPLEIVEVKKEEKSSKKATEGKSSPKLKVRRQFEHLLNLAAAQFQRSGSPSKAKLAGKTESKEKEKEKESNGEVLEPNLIKPSAVLKIQRGERDGIPSVQTVQAQEDAEQGKFLEEVKKQSRPAVPVKPEHLKPQINGTRSTPASHGPSEDESYNELGSWGEEVVRTANLKMQENGKRNAKSPPVTRLPTECANPADLGSLGEDIVRAARQKRLDDTPTDVTEFSEEIPGTPTEYSWDSASVCSDLTRDREEDESVSDRIFRKSFYSRFNDAVNSTQPPRSHKSAKNRRSTTQEILDTPISHIHRENTEESISLPPRNPNLKYARQTSNIRSEESDAVFVRKFLSRSSSRHLENFDPNPAEGNHRSSVVSPVEDVTESDRYGLRLIHSRESSVSRHSSLRDASMERSLPSSSSAKLRSSAATRDHSLSRFGDEKRSGTTSNSSVVTTLDMARNRSQTPSKSSYRTAESITSPATSSGNSEGREYRTYGASRTATSRFLGVDSDRSLTNSSSDSRSLNRRSMAPPVADYSTSSLPRRLNRFSLHESQPAIRSLTRPSQETSASRYSSLLEDQSPWSPTSLRRPGLSSDLSSTSSSSSSAYPRREATSTSILTRDRDRDSSLSRRDPTSSMFFRGASTGLATDSYATLRNSAYLRPRR